MVHRPNGPEPAKARTGRNVAWFVGLYVVSLIAFVGVVYTLRAFLPR